MQYTVLMGSTRNSRNTNHLRRTRIAQSAGWAVPSLALAIVGGVTIGFLFGWLLYWAFNVIGVWAYCDSRGSANHTTQRWFKRLSMVLVPTGVLGLLAGGRRRERRRRRACELRQRRHVAGHRRIRSRLTGRRRELLAALDADDHDELVVMQRLVRIDHV